MDVRFRTHRLERRYREYREAARAWGEEVGRRYVQRVDLLLAATAVADLYAARALAFHPLRGDRAGQYALRLTGADAADRDIGGDGLGHRRRSGGLS